MSSEEEAYLTKTLFEDKLPVTYRLLSRELSLNVHHAKTVLEAFYHAHEAELVPSYIISGKPKQDPSSQPAVTTPALAIMVVPGPDVPLRSREESQRALDHATAQLYDMVHGVLVYSLTVAAEMQLTVSEVVAGVETTLRGRFPVDEHRNKLAQWGIIRNSDQLPEFDAAAQPEFLQEEQKAATAKKGDQEKNEKGRKNTRGDDDNDGISSGYVSRKSQLKGKSAGGAGDAGTKNIFSTLKSKKSGAGTAKRSAESRSKSLDAGAATGKSNDDNSGSRSNKRVKTEPEEAYQYVSRKRQEPRERVVVSHGSTVKEEEEDDNVGEESAEARKQRKLKEQQQRKELESMFDDGDEDMDDNWDNKEIKEASQDAEVKSFREEEPEHITISTDQDTAASGNAVSVPSQSEVSNSIQEILQLPEDNTTDPVKEEKQGEEEEEDLQSYVDDDGYTVTKKKSSKPPAKKPAPPSEKARGKSASGAGAASNKNPKKMKQSNLLSFFGKR